MHKQNEPIFKNQLQVIRAIECGLLRSQYNMFTAQKGPQGELVTSIVFPDSPVSQKKQSSVPPESPLLKSKQNSSVKPTPQIASVSGPSLSHDQYLQGQLAKSERMVAFLDKQMIQQQMSMVETRVHDMESGEDKHVALDNIYKNSVNDNQFIEHGIRDVVNQVGSKVAANINHKIAPQRIIPKTKDDIKELQKVDKYRFLKIKNGQIKNKIGDLRHELENEYFQKKAKYILPNHDNVKESDYYSMENPRTQQANEFILKIQRQRQEEKEKFQQYLERKRQQIRNKNEADAQRRENEAQERRKRLEQIYKEKHMKKLAEQEQMMKKRQDHKQWSKLFNKQKPLYVKKQEQFIEKNLIPEIYHRRDRLLQIKMERRPIDIAEINEHDERYMEYKKDNQIRTEAQKELEREKLQAFQEDQRQLYKGKFRYMALQEMMNEKMKNSEDPKELQRSKKARQIVYADEVKDKLYQQIKLKQQQTNNLEKKTFTKRKRNMDGSTSMDVGETKMSSFTDPKVEGKKNMHFLKQLIKQRGIKQDRPIMRLVQQKNVYPDYLGEIHEKRRKSVNVNSSRKHDEEQLSVGQSHFDTLIAKQKQVNERVKRGQMRKKYNSLDYKEDASIEEEQMHVARLKMKLVSQLN